jgi:hypothetical protein
MGQAESWAMQELAKHMTIESKAKRLASEISFQSQMADIKRPSNVSVRQWDESGKGHDLLIALLRKDIGQ